jgi:hypothetical protein
VSHEKLMEAALDTAKTSYSAQYSPTKNSTTEAARPEAIPAKYP